MSKINRIRLRPLGNEDREWARQLLKREWGGPTVVTRGRAHDAADLPGFVAEIESQFVGLVTFHLKNAECELVTLNSLRPMLAIGSELVRAVKEKAIAAECYRLWLITTNDNVAALRFYQQRGFKLVALHRNALERSRTLKPHIPRLGVDGIPIRDEIELEIRLDSERPMSVIGLHHAQITIPIGTEDEARAFYCDILGLTKIEKPESLKLRGGFWVRVGDRDVHLGTEDGVDRAATKAHLAYQVTNIQAWRELLDSHGVTIKESIPLPGFDRFELRDPFGNRIEIIEVLK